MLLQPLFWASVWPDRLDRWFEDYTILHFGFQVHPRWVKATGMAESNLKADAVSWVGAEGLMQFMPGTWDWMAPAGWKELSAFDPEAAIFVGCKYMVWLWGKFPDSHKWHRKALVNASYNSGLGNIQKAKKKCSASLIIICCANEWDWPNVENHLVTRASSQKETRGYVARIRRFEEKLKREGE